MPGVVGGEHPGVAFGAVEFLEKRSLGLLVVDESGGLWGGGACLCSGGPVRPEP